ncbi:MAG: FtsW/RodA/SpoVE family cell cycle protein, partial [Patescibacteria group bacterium]
MSFRLFLPGGALLFMSLVVLQSIAPQLFFTQLAWILIGILAIVFFIFFDPRIITASSRVLWGLYIFVSGLLFLSLASPVVRETQAWIRLGAFNFQPVELMKISLILLYAYYFSRRHLQIKAWSTIIISFLLVVIPIGIVALQPDLGSALILGAIWFGFLLLSGLPWQRLAIMGAIFIVGLILMWSFVLKPYHKERIKNVFYPEQHALTFNYNVIQSKIAIGSAGWWGKGYGQGSQVQAGFLPEAETDFIFAALVEEWGWVI